MSILNNFLVAVVKWPKAERHNINSDDLYSKFSSRHSELNTAPSQSHAKLILKSRLSYICVVLGSANKLFNHGIYLSYECFIYCIAAL